MDIQYLLIKMIWGNRLYRRFLAPFDRLTVELKPSASFGMEPPAYNKLCRVSDGRNPLWAKGYADLGFPSNEAIFHRKIWEFNQTIYGLRTLRRLSPDAVALGLGCGHEELMYFLAGRIKMVYATDLYEGAYLGGESADDVLLHPDKYAPFRYPRERLNVMRMDARDLTFDPGTFDFLFCLSSLEHFGPRRDKLRSLQEMFRVLKPGGVAALTTELIVNRLGRRTDYFRIGDLERLIREAGFRLDESPDLRLEEEFARAPLALPIEVYRTPHVVLRNFGTIYTSLSLFLIKPGKEGAAGNAAIGPEIEKPAQPYDYRARLAFSEASLQIRKGKNLSILLKVKNEGDAVWYSRYSRSHNIRLGVWFATEDGRRLGGEPARVTLPQDVVPGDEVQVRIDAAAPKSTGTFRLHADLVKEYCFWFGDKGSSEATAAVLVE